MILLKEWSEPSNVEYITESDSGGAKHTYISGIFAEAELKNRNGRVYPQSVMESAVKKYVDDYVSKGRAISELSHPENRPMPKPEFASHLVTELKMVGSKAMGRAKVLKTPQGQILEGLLSGGVKMGVSTRALGSVSESNGTTYVGKDFQLFAVDAVVDPSGINCFVDSINESMEWLVTDDGQILEKTKKIISTTPRLTESQKMKLFQNFLIDISVK